MGRTLKRVPLDFAWPRGEIWEGYVNPHYKKCAQCDGHGDTASRRALKRIVYLLMIGGDDSHKGKGPHPWLIEAGIDDVGDALGEVSIGLSGREPGTFGYDGVATYKATLKVLGAAGLPEKWGWCAVCGGDCLDPAVKEAYEAWEEVEPPEGEGFQLWETTSEGSPSSPVFADFESLCDWCADNATTFGRAKATAAQWRSMLDADFVSHQVGNMIFC